MKTKPTNPISILWVTTLLCVAVCEISLAQGTTAFTYQGQLSDSGQPLELKVNNRRVLRLEPTIGDGPVNLIVGQLHTVDSNAAASTLSGGWRTERFTG